MKKLSLILLFIIISTFISAENAISLKNLENLAKQGNLTAQIELANSYRKGIRVTQD